jgi:dATP pyrophosphohydrolase
MSADGYRDTPAGGPRVRTDIVDVYVFRRSAGPGNAGVEFLQLLRAAAPLAATWHPVMGHIEAGETAVACALRELEEELGLKRDDRALMGVWALEQVHPYYVAEIDWVVLSPRFAAEVRAGWEPRINHEHTAARWVSAGEVRKKFMWPGQVAACGEIADHLLRPGSLSRDTLRVRT